jgi:hypothetical protein
MKRWIGIILIFLAGCAVLKTMENLARLKYRIHSAIDYQVLGIPVKEKKSMKDFKPFEIVKLSAGLLKGNMPLTFTLNIEAQNPNDGTSGSAQTDISIASFPWRLFLNEKEVVKGNIKEPIFVPGKGNSVMIPLEIEFDVAKLFKEKSLDDMLMLILQIGGVEGSTSNLKLKAQPSLGTPIGNIQYPDEITIVEKSFN